MPSFIGYSNRRTFYCGICSVSSGKRYHLVFEDNTVITWLHPCDCNPPHGLDLTPGSRDWEKVKWLYEMFNVYGFDLSKSALVGYPLDDRIQLLSGTHRYWAAALVGYPLDDRIQLLSSTHRYWAAAGILLPVTIWLRSYVEAYWGTPEWNTINRDIPVEELMKMERGEDVPPGLGDQIVRGN